MRVLAVALKTVLAAPRRVSSAAVSRNQGERATRANRSLNATAPRQRARSVARSREAIRSAATTEPTPRQENKSPKPAASLSSA